MSRLCPARHMYFRTHTRMVITVKKILNTITLNSQSFFLLKEKNNEYSPTYDTISRQGVVGTRLYDAFAAAWSREWPA